MDKNLFNNLSKDDLAEIWDKLNCWEWDYRLGEQPENWEAIPDFISNKHYKLPTKRDYLKPYMDYIEKTIGIKECMRWHHIYNTGKTNFQFEIWWLKSILSKIFKVGMYNKKFQKQLRAMLIDIQDKNQKEWINEKYYNNK